MELTDLIEQIRIRSGLRQNQFYTDTNIISLANKSNQKLEDLVRASNEHYLMVPFDFELTGGIGAGLDQVELPDDFIQGHSVDGNRDQGQSQYTVRYLSNWLQRNNYLNRFRPLYFFRAHKLVMYPSNRAAGTYRLWYTPQATPLVLPITVDFAIDTNDNCFVPPTGGLSGTGSWALLNSELNTDIPVDGSVDMNLTFASPPANVPFSGAYPIVSIGLPPTFGRPTMGCSNLASTTGFVGPSAGTGTYTYQPIGTLDALPATTSPYAEYIILDSSMAVRKGREQDCTDLEREFLAYQEHVKTSLTNRAEEPTQPPLTRRDNWDYEGAAWGEFPPNT